MVKKKTLRPYQLKAVHFLCAHLNDGGAALALVAPTGSGKTLILNTVLVKGLEAKAFQSALVAAPSKNTKSNFYEDIDVQGNRGDLRKVRKDNFAQLDEAGSTKEKRGKFDAHLGSSKPFPPFLLTTTSRGRLQSEDRHLRL